MASLLTGELPKFELWANVVAVLISLIAVIFWVKLYRNLYKGEQKETRGWRWLFVGVLSILLFNIASIYLLFVTTPIYELMTILGRTVVAISLTIGAYLLYSPMKKGFTYWFVPVKPVVERGGEGIKSKYDGSSKHFLEKGQSYMINEERPQKSNDIFLDLVNHGVHGLYITRRNPQTIRESFHLQKTPIIWLTREKSAGNSIDPRDLVELSHTVREFIKKTKNGVVLLDGLEYLIVQNSYKEILKFIQGLKDTISLSQSRLIIPLDPSAITQQQVHLLQREMSLIRAKI